MAKIVKEKIYNSCLVAIDIEHFKLFNRLYGRNKGDLFLTNLSDYILARAVRLDLEAATSHLPNHLLKLTCNALCAAAKVAQHALALVG